VLPSRFGTKSILGGPKGLFEAGACLMIVS
jgi:hypothetical protein